MEFDAPNVLIKVNAQWDRSKEYPEREKSVQCFISDMIQADESLGLIWGVAFWSA